MLRLCLIVGTGPRKGFLQSHFLRGWPKQSNPTFCLPLKWPSGGSLDFSFQTVAIAGGKPKSGSRTHVQEEGLSMSRRVLDPGRQDVCFRLGTSDSKPLVDFNSGCGPGLVGLPRWRATTSPPVPGRAYLSGSTLVESEYG